MGSSGNLVTLMGATVASLLSLISPAKIPVQSPLQADTIAVQNSGIELFEYIVITQTPTPTPTPLPTNTPTPGPTSRPVLSTELDPIFEKYANDRGISKDYLKKIAYCESHFNPGATNGPYSGMYQFSEGAWRSARSAMNENPDPQLRFNAEEAIKTAAFKISLGHQGIWPHCSR